LTSFIHDYFRPPPFQNGNRIFRIDQGTAKSYIFGAGAGIVFSFKFLVFSWREFGATDFAIFKVNNRLYGRSMVNGKRQL
jgi:hypothetical protein